MRIHSNTLPAEFIADLRAAAIRSNASPATIDKIDELHRLDEMESELEKAAEETYQAEKDRDDLREELACLLSAIGAANLEEHKNLQAPIKAAFSALERHGESADSLARIARDLAL